MKKILLMLVLLDGLIIGLIIGLVLPVEQRAKLSQPLADLIRGKLEFVPDE